MENLTESFIPQYLAWYYGSIAKDMNIFLSIPNEYSKLPNLKENAIYLDLFEKKNQNIDAKPYMVELLAIADANKINLYKEYELNKDKFIQAYNVIIEICDKTIKIIQDLSDKNIQANYTFNSSELINTYKSIKEESNSVDVETLQCDYDWIERTMPIIRVLHIEYVKVLDYQRLVKLQKEANLTEEEAISIIHYLKSKNLTSFYFKIGKYPENTLLVKKVMNRFSKKHDIRPEDTLEVFQEYIGDGKQSKVIMDHEIIVYC